jgi:internalin A
MKIRKNIFISYSHQDKFWLERLQTFLKPLVRSVQIDIWDDTQINPGANWQDEIQTALEEAQIAILLVSPNFLASDFIAFEELPKIFKKSSNEGLVIFWIAVSHSLFSETELSKFQAVNNPSKPLDSVPAYEQNQILVEICQKIKKAVHYEDLSATNKKINEIEIAPDDWDANPNSLFGKFKKFF